MRLATKQYVQDQILKQQEFERERFWKLWHRFEHLQAQHDRLLKYLKLEQKSIPEAVVIVPKENS